MRALSDNVLVASQIVKEGGLVVYPTDTVYGLGCSPFNVEAVKRIFKVKGERRKPLPVLASSTEHIEKIAILSKKAKKIAKFFWPGPLTLIISKKPVLPEVVTFGVDSVGVRIPNHRVVLQLITMSNGLLVGTSANKTGEEPSRTAQEAFEQLGEDVDIILDGGPATLGDPSTIIDLTLGKPRIIREGPIGFKEILNVLS